MRQGHGEISATLIRLILDENPADMLILDVGCGSGRLALSISPHCKEVVGIDWDEGEIERGRGRVRSAGITNIRLIVADAEKVDYKELVGGREIGMVAANLCMSDEILRRAHRALGRGSAVAFSCFHADQWRETGVISRFAYTQDRMEAVLKEVGFSPEYLGLEKEVIKFSSKEEVEEYLAGSPLRDKWIRDGRWDNLMRYIEGGGREFTPRSHLIIKARKISSSHFLRGATPGRPLRPIL